MRLVCALVLLLLAGCKDYGHELSRKVVELGHADAEWDTMDVDVGDVTIPVPIYEPERWWLVFEVRCEKGTYRKSVDVSKGDWLRHTPPR